MYNKFCDTKFSFKVSLFQITGTAGWILNAIVQSQLTTILISYIQENSNMPRVPIFRKTKDAKSYVLWVKAEERQPLSSAGFSILSL